MKKLLVLAIVLIGSLALFAQHSVYVEVFDCGGAYPALGDVEFQSYMTARPTEIITESNDVGSGYKISYGHGFIQVETANFATPPSTGDVLHIDANLISDNCCAGTFECVIDMVQGYQYYAMPGDGMQMTEQPCAVTLTSFQAVMQGEFAAISWTTASEADLRNFNVYRDGVLIHQEDATNTSENTDYTFVDQDVENGMTYKYDLEAVNLDGTTSNIGNVELTIEIDNPEEVVKTEFQNVYPNPVSVGVEQHIKLAVKTGETATMTIYNAKGQVVNTFDFNQGNHDFTFTPKFASGIYFYKLEGNNYSAVKKMLILK